MTRASLVAARCFLGVAVMFGTMSQAAGAAPIKGGKRDGPIVVVASGTGWTYYAWNTTRGLCDQFVSGIVDSSYSCGNAVVGAPPDLVYPQPPPTKQFVCDFNPDDTYPPRQGLRTVFTCVASATVARIVLVLTSGQEFVAQRYAAPPALKTKIGFFLIRQVPGDLEQIFISDVLAGGTTPGWQSLSAFDATGSLIDTQSPVP